MNCLEELSQAMNNRSRHRREEQEGTRLMSHPYEEPAGSVDPELQEEMRRKGAQGLTVQQKGSS